MAKTNEVVQKGVRQLQDALKQIRASNEEDLGKIAESFDGISSQADEIAQMLYAADKALSGEHDDEDDESPNEDEEGA